VKNTNKNVIVLARHGQTDFNLENRIQDPVRPRLTEIGYQQARVLGEEIKKMGITFDVIICSDMTRNKETLTEIYPDYKKMNNVKIDPRLRERYHGDLTGKTKTDVEKEIGQKFEGRLSWELYFEGTDKSKLTARNYPNDESIDSVRKRLKSIFSELNNASKIFLIGSAIINQYILEFLQIGTSGISRPEFPKGNILDFQGNNELRIITIDENMKMQNYSSIKY
jgi:broad specificity phosphatase PhoE